MRRTLLLLALAIFTVACQSSSGGPNLIVPPDDEGRFPPNLRVGCPNGPTFPISALETMKPLDNGGSGMVAAAREFLDSGEGDFWPQDGWMILHTSLLEAILVAPAAEGVAFMTLSRGFGGWDWTSAQGGGVCPLQFAAPSNMNTVNWELDPAVPAPTPGSTSIQVILMERDCVSGQAIGSRLVGPQVVVDTDEVWIAFAARRPPGDAQTCPGNPPMRYTVTLPEPLGDRRFVEGRGLGINLEDYLD